MSELYVLKYVSPIGEIEIQGTNKAGTDFQQKVWNALVSVGYGKTIAYKDIALAIGNEKAIRAVGSANGKNKLSIVIPCHRIIGSNQKLTDYAGGLWRKEWLLQHEKRCLRS